MHRELLKASLKAWLNCPKDKSARLIAALSNCMHITDDDAAHMYARACRAWYGRRVKQAMSRFLLNIEKRSLPWFTLSGVGLASKNAM